MTNCKQNNLSNNFIEFGTILQMINKTAYLNGFTKSKEIQITMESHKQNLKHMRSINRNQPNLNPIEINKNKAKYLKKQRDQKIFMQNEILMHNIEKIIKNSGSSKYYSSSEKYSKSLNGYIKRTTQQKINEQNLKFLVRLEDSKPTYSTKKYLQEFQHLKKVEKKMSSVGFYLTDSPTFRKRKVNANCSLFTRRNSSFQSKSSYFKDKAEIIKQSLTLNDGNLWEIQVYRDERQLKITGELFLGQNQAFTEIKLIKMPIFEANIFLRKHCQNNPINLLKYLKVDEQDGSLMLIVPNVQKSFLNSPMKLVNPEEKSNSQIKLNKLQSFEGYQKKTPSRHIFNNIQKPIQLELLNKNQQKKDEFASSKKHEMAIETKEKQLHLKTDSQNKASKAKIHTKSKEQQEKPQKKINVSNNKQNSVSSIKSSQKHLENNNKDEYIENPNQNMDKKTSDKAELHSEISEKQAEKQQNYEEENFEQSNPKPNNLLNSEDNNNQEEKSSTSKQQINEKQKEQKETKKYENLLVQNSTHQQIQAQILEQDSSAHKKTEYKQKQSDPITKNEVNDQNIDGSPDQQQEKGEKKQLNSSKQSNKQ